MLTEDISFADGDIRGLARSPQGVLAFLGIPYAAPPLGRLRWRAPRDVESWQGRRDAAAFGRPAYAAAFPGTEPLTAGQSEDCLTLNVWTAATTADEKRPVMVWIHGGGFEFGSSAWPAWGGGRYAQKGVVLVSFNYRLGVFGFLAHPDLDVEGPASGNFGLRDQIKALQWVQQNISRFGGDPGNVTVFGESAGAHAIGLLMTSPMARGLFHRAIGQSGAWWDSEHGSISTRQEALVRTGQLMKKLGVNSLAELCEVPAEKLNKASGWKFLLDPGTTAFAPIIDGDVLPRSPALVFERGEQLDVPLLAGWNAEEHSYFMSRALPAKPAAFRKAAAAQFGESHMADFLAAFPAATKAETMQSAEWLAGDLIISQQTWEWLGTHRKTSRSGVYGYNFEYTSPYSTRAMHASEIPFVFGNLIAYPWVPKGVVASPEDHQLSDLMMGYWINFARSGDPNDPAMPHWPVYEGAGSQVMRFATKSAPAQERGTTRFQFIQSFRKAGNFPASWREVEGRLPVLIAALIAKVVVRLKRAR